MRARGQGAWIGGGVLTEHHQGDAEHTFQTDWQPRGTATA